MAGLDILKGVWQKTHDVYSMRLKCMANTFQGKTCSELQTWYYSWQKEARMCNLLNMSEEEYKVFTLLTNMPIQFKTLLMTSNTRPNLKETLEFVDRQMQVESICKTMKGQDQGKRRAQEMSATLQKLNVTSVILLHTSDPIVPTCIERENSPVENAEKLDIKVQHVEEQAVREHLQDQDRGGKHQLLPLLQCHQHPRHPRQQRGREKGKQK